MVAQVEESMSHWAIAQWLELEIEAIAIGTAMTSARNTQAIVDRLCGQVEVQMTQNCIDLEHKLIETQETVQKIVVDLEDLTRQLNSYKLASEGELGKLRGKITSEVTNQLCCAFCSGVIDWHNCGTIMGALDYGLGLVEHY